QTGGSQRHTNHGEHPASVVEWTGAGGAQNCDIMQIFRIMCKGVLGNISYLGRCDGAILRF
ncbi:hypothetical protein, partial [Pseudomonas sp. Sample_14]|uniref:hypothetical protein n=1 Tax=Pseudomonas sp. Sample_14 TaxID=2448262 RepID=UPI0019D61E3E